jgi:pimeloyl-[acyl-carrier protein] synthase
VLTRFSADRTPTPQYFEALGAPEVSPIARIMINQMLFMDAPAHTRLRKLAGPAFTPARVHSLRPHIQEIATRLIDDIYACGFGAMDLLADFAEPLPAIVTSEMLGVPVADHVQLKKWSVTFAEMLGNFQHNPDRLSSVLHAVENLVAYFNNAIHEQRKYPRNGLIQALMSSEVDGDQLTDEEIVANCIVTLIGGLETTTNLIGNGILTLLRNPHQLTRLRVDPDIMPHAIEELLRYESPSQHTARLAPDDVVLGGEHIRKRQAVIAVMAAANRDPEHFSNPDRLDFDRPDKRHLAFGWAAHFCFGAPLARLEAEIAFDSLLRRFPYLRLTEAPLVWRENLGLRGLKNLPLSFAKP